MPLKLALIIIVLLLSSCTTSSQRLQSLVDCSKIDQELNERNALFTKLSLTEINNRNQLKVTAFSALNELSVFSKIVDAVLSAPQNAKLIPVDLRYYKDVELGNIIVSNVAGRRRLADFLQISKYSQTFFALINFNATTVTIAPPLYHQVFEKTEIGRPDLKGAELVINASNASTVTANMKFSSGQKVSIIADNVSNPSRLDLREASNMQFNLDQKWIMQVYSLENSQLCGGKKTTGLFKFVNNKNGVITNPKFNQSFAACYSDKNGNKF